MIEAVLIVNQDWHLALPLALVIPAVIMFIRQPFIAVILWLLILPYFLNEPTAAGRFIYWIVHRAIIPAALGVVIISGWLKIDKKRQPIHLGPAELSLLLFLGLLIANIFLFNHDPQDALIHAYDRVFIPFCMYWLIRLVAPGEKELKWFLWVALITVLVQAAIGITSWFAPELLPSKWLGLQGERTVGSLRNVAVYTSTLFLCALLLFQYAVNSSLEGVRFWLLAIFGLALYCVFMSFSRASWLGGIVILSSLFFIYPKVILRMFIVMAVIIYILSGTLLVEQVAWGYERLNGEEAQRSAESRATVTNASLKMIEKSPYFGWGYGNFDQFKRPFMERVGNIVVHDRETSHNTYLSIMTELGIIGFLFYYFPLVWWFILSLKVLRRLPKQGFWSWQLLVILWLVIVYIMMVTSFMDMFRFFPFGNTLWWLTLGLVANVVHAQHEYKNTNPIALRNT
ncbi:MAG: O-antigen ligase family protein [Anaerolineales bacterium]|nr:O-antigen ligase family protein [Anaerolineales bacterium]